MRCVGLAALLLLSRVQPLSHALRPRVRFILTNPCNLVALMFCNETEAYVRPLVAHEWMMLIWECSGEVLLMGCVSRGRQDVAIVWVRR